MFKRTFRQMFFWSTNAWKNFVSVLRRQKTEKRPTPNLSRPARPHGSFAITQDSHPRKVQRWMNRGGSVQPTTSDLARYAMSHIHPRALRP